MTTFHNYQLKQDLLKEEFGNRYQEWNEPRPMDDRNIFCNLYEIYLRACEDMKTVDNVHIQCAVNARLQDDLYTMRRISSRF